MNPPQEVMSSFGCSRHAKRAYGYSLGIDALEYSSDRTVLACGIESLKHNEQGIVRGTPELALQLLDEASTPLGLCLRRFLSVLCVWRIVFGRSKRMNCSRSHDGERADLIFAGQLSLWVRHVGTGFLRCSS